jgi:hypothetical protein
MEGAQSLCFVPDGAMKSWSVSSSEAVVAVTVRVVEEVFEALAFCGACLSEDPSAISPLSEALSLKRFERGFGCLNARGPIQLPGHPGAQGYVQVRGLERRSVAEADEHAVGEAWHQTRIGKRFTSRSQSRRQAFSITQTLQVQPGHRDLERIVILDTNALHGDVYLVGPGITTLFAASDEDLLERVEIWTPQGVVEELVRQFPERVARMKKVLGAIGHDLASFGIDVELPDRDARALATYRDFLVERLTGPRRKVVGHPRESGKVIEWAAAHRLPIKTQEEANPPLRGEPDLRHFAKPKPRPIFGVVDAAIWLTVIEAAQRTRVALITNNSKDFSDPVDASKPCARLGEDLEIVGVNPGKVEILARPTDFNRRYVRPVAEAKQMVEGFLSSEGRLEALKAEISDSSEWFAASLDEGLGAGVEIDDVSLQSFDVETINLLRADPAVAGVWATLEVNGEGRVDLGIRKGEAIHLPADSPITVYDWNWNESMVAAEAELPVWALVEGHLDQDGEFGISIEEIRVG